MKTELKTKILLLTITIFIITSFNVVLSQEFDYHRDFKKILKKTSKPKNELNYDKLLTRFTNADTTLTPYEVLALQIGFTEKEAYNPYGNIKIERTYLGSVYNDKTDTCILYGVPWIKRNPLNLSVNYALYKAYEKKGNLVEAEHFKTRYFLLIKSILFSGKDNKPYFVLSPIDGQTLITEYWEGEVGNMGTGKDKNGYFLDLLEMIKDGKSTNLSFHINHATDKMFDK